MSNLNKVVGFRVTPNLYEMLKTVSRDRGEDVSDFIRRAVLKELASLSFLPEEQKKALGIPMEPRAARARLGSEGFNVSGRTGPPSKASREKKDEPAAMALDVEETPRTSAGRPAK